MSTSADPRTDLSPKDVLDALSRHILVDGYHVVMDFERSRGSYLYDARSNRPLLDFFTNFATIPLGYNHPKMADAEFRERLMQAALTKPANSDIYTSYYADFVENFSRRAIPKAFGDHLFFVEGGAMAVENTIKTAFDWKVRKNLARGIGSPDGTGVKGSQVLHFQNAFHGRSGYTLSMTNTADPRKTQYFPKFDWPRLSCPALSFPVTPGVIASVEKAEEAVEREIREACAQRKDDIAALILEPIQGEGGDNHFRPELFRRLRALADELEFLLIFDEVQTGVGLTGSMWCWQQMGVEPDIFCFGKKTQVCGFAANHRVDDVDSVFKVSSRINSTWGGNLVDMVRAEKYFEIIDEENLIENARVVGEYMLGRLREMADEFPGVVSNVRGRGLFLALTLPDKAMRDKTLAACLENGLIALASGVSAVRFRPALTLSKDEADEGVRKLRRAIASAK
jgi:L-lysine 6-transaminase